MPALLKFLGGAQAGSEASLPSGEYVLGGGDAADLVLADVAVKPRHALLRIHDDSWEIEPLEGAEVRVDGARVEGNALVSPYQVVSLGGTHIALGPDGPWERLPEIPQPLSDGPRAADGDPHPARAENEAETGTNEAASEEGGGNVPDRTGSIPEEGDASKRRGGRKWPWLALFPLAAAGLAAYYCLLAANPDAGLADLVRERLVAAGFSAARDDGGVPLPGVIGVDAAGSRRVRLSGLLATERERRRAIEAAELPDAALEDGLRSVEGEVNSLAGVLGAIGPAVRVSLLGGGFSVLLAGVVETAQDAEAIFRLTRERLDQRIGIRRRLWLWRELAREAEREARRLGIAGVRFARENGAIVLEADSPVSAERRRELTQAIDENLGSEAAAFLASAVGMPAEPSGPAAPPGPDREVDSPPIPAPEERNDAREALKREALKKLPTIMPMADSWQVKDVFGDGFRDQGGKVWRVGDIVGNGFLVAGVWRDGVVFQKGEDTLLIRRGGVLFAVGGKTGNH
ncbi:MAG: FHA domain-containing protein [Planctomycetota bacterium]|jgi:hypothetical protein|nr:FHA domain-containing protein [Planctomycetota bacterium]